MIDLAEFNKTLTAQLIQALVLSSGFIILFACMLIWFINRKTVRPVTQIQKNVRQYTDNKDTDLIVAEMEKVKVNNEFGILAGDIARLAKEIDRYTYENILLAADHERIATELDLATKIQRDAIPATFPAFPDRTEFDIYASMEPAKEVGGDFYDFFLVDDDHSVHGHSRCIRQGCARCTVYDGSQDHPGEQRLDGQIPCTDPG